MKYKAVFPPNQWSGIVHKCQCNNCFNGKPVQCRWNGQLFLDYGSSRSGILIEGDIVERREIQFRSKVTGSVVA